MSYTNITITTNTNLSFVAGGFIEVIHDSSNYIFGQVVSYNSSTGSLTFTPVDIVGSGTYTSWTIVCSGAPGTSGTSGTDGTSGSSGTSGATGTSGASGTSGTSGVSGTSGTSGVSGTSGTSGIDGTSGVSGTSGTSGVNGAAGTSGVSGTSGTSGVNGINGTSGTSGINGTSGVSGTSGTSGTSGLSGTSGTSGTSVSVSGTTNYVVKFTSATTIGNSTIYDNGSVVSIGTTTTGFNSYGLPLVVGSGTGNQGITVYSGSSAYGSLHFAYGITGAQSYNGGLEYSHLDNQLNLLSGATVGFIVKSNQVIVPIAGAHTAGSQNFHVEGSARINTTLYIGGQLTLGSTITNGTYTYTLPGATGTLALTSQIPAASQWTTSGSDIYYNTGNVGIGTSSPNNKLVVSNNGAYGFEFDPVNGTLLTYNRSTSSYSGLNFNSSEIVSYISGTEKMRISSAGNVGIGTSSPAEKLSVYLAASKSVYARLGANNLPSIGFLNDNASAYVPGEINFSSLSLTGGNVGVNCTANAQFEVLGASGNALTDGIRVSRNTLQSSQYGVINYSSGILNLTGVNTSGGGALRFSTSDGTTTNERMRITSAGNIGIGTSSPSYILHAQATSANVAYFNRTTTDGDVLTLAVGGTNAFIFNTTSGVRNIQAPGAVDMTMWTNGSERMRITSGGSVSIGTTGALYATSAGRLNVQASGASEPVLMIANSSTSVTTTLLGIGTGRTAASSAFNFIDCLTGNSSGDQFVTEQFKVRGDGVIYAQNTSVQSISDIRTKENIVNSNEGLNVINELRPVRFDFKEGFGNNKKNQLGFIAQEVEKVFPDAVDVWGKSDDENNPYKSLGTAALIPVLVKAIQELKAEIDELKNK